MTDLVHKHYQEIPILFALTKNRSIITSKPHKPTHSNSKQKGFKIRKHFLLVSNIGKLNLRDIQSQSLSIPEDSKKVICPTSSGIA